MKTAFNPCLPATGAGCWYSALASLRGTDVLRYAGADYESRTPLMARPDLGDGGSLRPVVDLLVEQIECEPMP